MFRFVWRHLFTDIRLLMKHSEGAICEIPAVVVASVPITGAVPD